MDPAAGTASHNVCIDPPVTEHLASDLAQDFVIAAGLLRWWRRSSPFDTCNSVPTAVEVSVRTNAERATV